jgi:triacylglycerol lipase
MVTVIQQDGEEPLELHSELRGPIRGLSLLRRSLLFAELSLIAYNDYAEALAAATVIGLPDVQFFNHDGSQAYRFRNRHDCVIACRGTEPHEWNDIRADANAVTALAETVGRVHRGFKREVDDLWPMLEVALRSNTLPTWFCGHSLGGAMAAICAARCYKSSISSNPEEVYTFGSPRIGDRQYMNHARLTYYRWVNNNDVVTRVPPRWMGYIHGGQELYLDFRGRLKRYSGWQRTKDRLRGFIRGLANRSFDHFVDHGVREYQRHILGAVLREEGRIAERPSKSEVIHLPPRRHAA